MQNIAITLQPILSENELLAKIFTSSITSVIAEWLGNVLHTPSLSGLFWRLGSVIQSCHHCGFYWFSCRRWVRWGWWLTKQLHRQSIHRQDGLAAYSLYSLFVFGHWLGQVVPVVQQAISYLSLHLYWSARLMKTSGRLPHPSFSAWMRFPEGENLRHHSLSFFRFWKHSSPGASLHSVAVILCLNADQSI